MMAQYGIVIKISHLLPCDIGNSIRSMILGIIIPTQTLISMSILYNIRMHHISANDKPMEMEDYLIGLKLSEMHHIR